MYLYFEDFLLLLAMMFACSISIIGYIAHFRAFMLMGYSRPWLGLIPWVRDIVACKAVRLSSASFGFFFLPIIVIQVAYPLLYSIMIIAYSDYEFTPILVALGVVILLSAWKYTNMLAIIRGKSVHESFLLGVISAFCPLVAFTIFLTASPDKVGWVF